MLNLGTPSNLEKGQLEFRVQHRFFGPVDEDPFDKFFGMDAGANVGLMLRGPVWRKLEVSGAYVTDLSEWLAGLSYTRVFADNLLRTQMDIKFFSFKEFDTSPRESNLFYQAALQADPLGGRIVPVLNIGYDSYNRRGGLGFGARAGILEKVSIQGEYYPVTGRDDHDQDSPLGPENAFAFGVELQTHGHHFLLMLGNSQGIGTRALMLGTYSNDLYFGFNIQRLFYL
jgi:hypothetical protein